MKANGFKKNAWHAFYFQSLKRLINLNKYSIKLFKFISLFNFILFFLIKINKTLQ